MFAKNVLPKRFGSPKINDTPPLRNRQIAAHLRCIEIRTVDESDGTCRFPFDIEFR